MNPIFLDLGKITIHWYGVFMALAFSMALASWTLLGRRRAWRFQDCSDILLWVMLGGIFGARINYILSEFSSYKSDPFAIFRVYEGGLIFYGGFIGACVAILILAKRRRIPLLAMTDFVASSLPLGHALGRIGCFMNGCCFGRPTDGAIACTFPKYSPPWHEQFSQHYHSYLQSHGLDPSSTIMGVLEKNFESIPVYPVQLFETAANLGVFLLLAILFLKTRRTGIVTGAYLLTYPLARFVLETFRGTERIMVGPISTAQMVSLIMMMGGAVILVVALKTKHVFEGPGQTLDNMDAPPESAT